jgi:hypothetical protein
LKILAVASLRQNESGGKQRGFWVNDSYSCGEDVGARRGVGRKGGIAEVARILADIGEQAEELRLSGEYIFSAGKSVVAGRARLARRGRGNIRARSRKFHRSAGQFAYFVDAHHKLSICVVVTQMERERRQHGFRSKLPKRNHNWPFSTRNSSPRHEILFEKKLATQTPKFAASLSGAIQHFLRTTSS